MVSSLSLAALIRVLGTASVRVVSVPAGTELDIVGPRIFDPDDPSMLGRDEVVLGVNVQSDALPELFKAAAAAGAAAVVVKETLVSEDALKDLANETGVAALSASAGVTWDQVAAVVRNAATTGGLDAPGGSDTPIRDLFALADAIAALVGGAVTIEDRQSNLLAYSNLDQPIDTPRLETILGRRLPDRWAEELRDQGFFAQLLDLPPRVVRIADERVENVKPRLATTIRAGDELLGYMWAVQGEEPFKSEAENALLEGTRLAALYLLKHQAAGDLRRSERAALLRDLLDGRKAAREAGAALGIEPGAPCAVVGFRFLVDDDVELSVKRTKAVDLITVACEAFRRRVVISTAGHSVYALFPDMEKNTLGRLVGLVRSIADQAKQTLGDVLIVGVGNIVADLASATKSRDEADRALRVLAAEDSTRRVATIDDVRMASVLQSVGDFLLAHEELKLPALDALTAYDRAHGAMLVDTLRAFVDASFDTPAAARELGVHPNSVRYRLRRIEEIARVDLQDVRHLLVISLELFATGGQPSR